MRINTCSSFVTKLDCVAFLSHLSNDTMSYTLFSYFQPCTYNVSTLAKWTVLIDCLDVICCLAKMLSMVRLWNKRCSETGPKRRCSGPEWYQYPFWYYHYCCLFYNVPVCYLCKISGCRWWWMIATESSTLSWSTADYNNMLLFHCYSDFVNVRHWETRDGIILSAGCAVFHPSMPPCKKHVR